MGLCKVRLIDDGIKSRQGLLNGAFSLQGARVFMFIIRARGLVT